jgi:hypothetical protein
MRRERETIMRSRRLMNRGRRPLKLIVRFHMTVRAIFLSALGVSLVNSASAKCAYHAEVLAAVTVHTCIAVKFGASDSKYTYFPDSDPSRMYKVGESLSGTLLTVSVKTSRFVWTADTPHFVGGTRLWAKGDFRSVFVQGAPSEVCPQVLPIDATVQTQPTCCDTTPGGWECLLPGTISLVTLSAPKTRG